MLRSDCVGWDVKEGIFTVCYVCVDQITLDHMVNMPENVNKENLKYWKIKEHF